MAATATLAALPAQAAEFVLKSEANGTAVGSGAGNARNYTIGSTVGNEKLNVHVTAWNRQLSDNRIAAAEVGYFGSDGLGALVPGETASNSHQIDNVNGWEFLVLQFDRSVTLQSAQLNMFSYGGKPLDNDAFIAATGSSPYAWNTNLPLGGLAWDSTSGMDLSEYFTISKNVGNDGPSTSSMVNFNVNGTSSNVWLIGASINGPDGLNDAFKLSRLTVTAVPEPATWAMMLTGFAMVGAAARYRRRKTGAAIA
ncbi:PEPxxWA-CTERM sorting domain-containing protein [Sphingomonas sp. 1P08PE]|uniref:PEPxxWA-CTERM sorting domain-containing protein n=1 Tax=Sphingomonas sp. 1P08PE TaxID=554122 RepID=UPI00399F11F5